MEEGKTIYLRVRSKAARAHLFRLLRREPAAFTDAIAPWAGWRVREYRAVTEREYYTLIRGTPGLRRVTLAPEALQPWTFPTTREE